MPKKERKERRRARGDRHPWDKLPSQEVSKGTAISDGEKNGFKKNRTSKRRENRNAQKTGQQAKAGASPWVMRGAL